MSYTYNVHTDPNPTSDESLTVLYPNTDIGTGTDTDQQVIYGCVCMYRSCSCAYSRRTICVPIHV